MRDPSIAERSVESVALQTLLSNMQSRLFARQLRSEECGCCMSALAEQLMNIILDNPPVPFHLLLRILPKIDSFHPLPRFVLKVLVCCLKFMQAEIEKDKAAGVDPQPSAHQLVSDAIKTLSLRARRHYTNADWMLFSRIAEPLQMITAVYEDICNSCAMPQKQRATRYLKLVSKLRGELEEQQADDEWAKHNRCPLGDETQPKQVWSGGSCIPRQKEDDSKLDAVRSGAVHSLQVLMEYCKHMLANEQKTGRPLLKILTYSQKTLVAYSRHRITKDVHRCDLFLNSVDLPFTGSVKLMNVITRDKLPPSRQILMDKLSIQYCYECQFEDLPEPRYYFLSLCHDLFEQSIEWGPNSFSAMFCQDFQKTA